ncbi:MAG: 5,6-dimethylbenzimidazole synthase [Rickettsiales bacterium]
MTNNNTFSDAEKLAVYRAIWQRRDVRRFRSEPIEDEILQRILQAAAHAPSVGYMQPWIFLLIRDGKIRGQIHDAFVVANNEAKEMFEDERKAEYAALKLEGITESSLNIVVTCDRSRFGKVILGRTCQPDMDLYSSVCAVQNLWLAARAENVGVGWVSIIKPQDLQSILQLPENVVPIAYLCVGYTDSFASEPELKTSGWLPEIPLADLVFYEKWGQLARDLNDASSK